MSARRDRIEEQFSRAADASFALNPHWRQTVVGSGQVCATADGLQLRLEGATADRYSDAQLDDYSGRRASQYPWQPPLRMRVRARASHAAHPAEPSTYPDDRWLRGTAGFGFWNAPFTLAGGSVRLPEAVWFFAASPPSNMALTPDGAGYGWKAQVIHSHRLAALMAAPPLALTALWARVSGDARPAAGWMEQLTGAQEQPLDLARADLRQWHDYTIEWQPDIARFALDGQEVLAAPSPPQGPLGFVAWIDNQYAIATPRGELRFGAVACQPQWLELASVSIEPLT